MTSKGERQKYILEIKLWNAVNQQQNFGMSCDISESCKEEARILAMSKASQSINFTRPSYVHHLLAEWCHGLYISDFQNKFNSLSGESLSQLEACSRVFCASYLSPTFLSVPWIKTQIECLLSLQMPQSWEGWFNKLDDKKHFKHILTGWKDEIKIIRWNIIEINVILALRLKGKKKKGSI